MTFGESKVEKVDFVLLMGYIYVFA
jgi:hypothetical protein